MIVAAIGVAVTRRMEHTILDDAFHVPTATAVDARLLLGSAIFGIGWGIAGFCPGPALAALSYGTWPVAAFVTAMAIGMIAHDRVVPPARERRYDGPSWRRSSCDRLSIGNRPARRDSGQ